MLTDSYLIDYLINKYGYSKEEVESEGFYIADLEAGDFAIPIDLSRIANISELKIFSEVGVCFLTQLDDIAEGKLDKISKMLKKYDFFSKDPVLIGEVITTSNDVDIKIDDIRKSYAMLDLNAPENQDLLNAPENLKNILKNNYYIVSILVPEKLTTQQKTILEEYASNIDYNYMYAFVNEEGTKETYAFFTNEQEYVNFKTFMEADKVFEEIVSGIKEEWGELEKFKYLYNELGKRVSYDINVLPEKNEDMDSLFVANIVARNIFKSILTGKGVCTSFAEMYRYVCKKSGLTCEIELNDTHMWNVIQYTDENGNKVKTYCDLTEDSKNIKCNYPCWKFGVGTEEGLKGKSDDKSVTKIPYKQIIKIDKKLGYNYALDEYNSLEAKFYKIKNIEKKIGFILKKMMQIQDLSGMSNNEIVEMAAELLATGSRKYDEDVGIAEAFIRKEERVDKDVRTILWVKKNNKEEYLYYTFNSEQQEFKSLDKETVEELLASGMLEFYKGQKLPGFEEWISEKEYKQLRNFEQDR